MGVPGSESPARHTNVQFFIIDERGKPAAVPEASAHSGRQSVIDLTGDVRLFRSLLKRRLF